MKFKEILTDWVHLNSPGAGVIAVITLADMKDLAVIISLLVGTVSTAAVAWWKIKNNKT